MSRVIAVIACGFTVAACSASMPSLNFFSSSPSTETVGTISARTETVRFESKPSGAEVKTSAGTCRTPCELSVQVAPEISATFVHDSYQPQTISLRQEPNSPKLAPNPVFVELRAVPAGAGKKHLKKKRPAVAARANSPPSHRRPHPRRPSRLRPLRHLRPRLTQPPPPPIILGRIRPLGQVRRATRQIRWRFKTSPQGNGEAVNKQTTAISHSQWCRDHGDAWHAQLRLAALASGDQNAQKRLNSTPIAQRRPWWWRRWPADRKRISF
jgi:hypothetical protein